MGIATFALAIALLSPAQADTIVDAVQVEDRVEVLVAHPERTVGELYFRQHGQVTGPLRLKPGENRLEYTLLRTGQPLAQSVLEIGHYNGQGQLLAAHAVTVIEPFDLPPHSSMSLTPDDIRAIRKRFLLEERAGRVLGTMLDEANEQLAGPLYLPDVGGTWSNDYRCPDHGDFLEMVTLHQHRCPTDGKIWTGEKFDSALATFLHLEAGHQAWVQALAWMLTGNQGYADRVRAILTGYAQYYPGYEQHDWQGKPSPRGGKAFGQTLDEAIWLIDLLRAFDLLRGSGVLTPAEEESFREHVARLALAVIEGNDLGIANIQNWHNSAIFLAALTVGDTPAASRAVRGPTGIREQALLGVDADGLWYEGSFGYHFYTFRAMLPMLQAIPRIGALLDVQRVESMLRMPLRAAFPDGSLAMLNDGAFQTFADNLRNDYEQALPFWPDADFCGPLAEYGRGQSYESVVYGLADLPFEDWQDYPGTNFESSGVAILRSGPKGDRTTVTVDYGPHGGFHGHYDKLGLGIWHEQKPIMLESGAIGYGTSLSDGYYTRTLAHNTVVINGADQAECTGALEDYEVDGENARLVVSADDAYPGVELRRQVVNTEWGHLVDGVSITTSQPVTVDYVLHSAGTITHNYSLSVGSLGYGGAYDYLSQVRTASFSQDLEFQFEGPEGSAVVNLVGEPGTQVFLARAPGYPQGSEHDVLIVRRQAAHTVFGLTITENGATADGFEVELDDQPGDPALRLKVQGVGQMRLPFYP